MLAETCWVLAGRYSQFPPLHLILVTCLLLSELCYNVNFSRVTPGPWLYLQVVIGNCTCRRNEAESGAAVGAGADVKMTTFSSIFRQNSATGYGGAIFSESSAVMYIKSSSLQSNVAQWGGALYYHMNILSSSQQARRLLNLQAGESDGSPKVSQMPLPSRMHKKKAVAGVGKQQDNNSDAQKQSG